LRIISGKYRGRLIHPPKGFEARPTTDYAKESLFNILANRIDFEGLQVLDLFAGSGGIGFEFASRGAVQVDSVELNYLHGEFIKQIARELQLPLKLIKANAFSFLKKPGKSYDVVFADPPYNLNNIATLPELVLSGNWLKTGGFFILEHSSAYSFENQEGFVEMRNYGSVHFSFFEKK
jgi:16S rRNA (guanine(966)-N(2))-methyltransferase RsmD